MISIRLAEMGMINNVRDDIFNGNLEILKKRFPDAIPYLDQRQFDDPFSLQIGTDAGHRQSVPHIRRADGRIRPLYDRITLDRLLQKIATTQAPEPHDMVFILGMGAGEAGLEVIRRYRKKPRIVIIEPYPSLFRMALRTKALDTLLNNERLSLYLGAQADAEKILEDWKRILPIGRTLLFIYPYQQQLIGKKYKRVENDLVHRIRSARDMWHTTRRFGRQMLMNALANLPYLINGTPLRVLRDRFRGKPVICVAAGPSLSQALPLLKTIGNALIIACDSAVGTLLQADIQPHIVATADIHASNINKLRPHRDRLRNTILAFGLECNPETVRTFLGSRRVGMTAYSRLVLDSLDQSLDLQCSVPPMTSVTHLAVLLSIAMGADPIVLVGVDMAYLDGQSHAHGSVYSHIPEDGTLVPVRGVDGSIVAAPPQLVTDRLILEQIVAQHSNRIVNVSLRGAFVSGVEVKSLKDVIADDLADKLDVQLILDAIPRDASPAAEIVQSELQKVICRFEELKKEGCLQRRRISRPLKRRHPIGEPLMGKKEYQRSTLAHAEFQRQCRSMIVFFQDAMLNEVQAIIKKQEIIGATPDDCQTGVMVDELEAIDAYYRGAIKVVESIIDGLKSI